MSAMIALRVKKRLLAISASQRHALAPASGHSPPPPQDSASTVEEPGAPDGGSEDGVDRSVDSLHKSALPAESETTVTDAPPAVTAVTAAEESAVEMAPIAALCLDRTSPLAVEPSASLERPLPAIAPSARRLPTLNLLASAAQLTAAHSGKKSLRFSIDDENAVPVAPSAPSPAPLARGPLPRLGRSASVRATNHGPTAAPPPVASPSFRTTRHAGHRGAQAARLPRLSLGHEIAHWAAASPRRTQCQPDSSPARSPLTLTLAHSPDLALAIAVDPSRPNRMHIARARSVRSVDLGTPPPGATSPGPSLTLTPGRTALPSPFCAGPGGLSLAAVLEAEAHSFSADREAGATVQGRASLPLRLNPVPSAKALSPVPVAAAVPALSPSLSGGRARHERLTLIKYRSASLGITRSGREVGTELDY